MGLTVSAELFFCVKQYFRLSFRPDLELEATLPRICPKTKATAERIDSSRHNTKQIRLIQGSEEWSLYCSVGERLVLNEYCDIGGSVPEFGAIKPCCSDSCVSVFHPSSPCRSAWRARVPATHEYRCDKQRTVFTCSC